MVGAFVRNYLFRYNSRTVRQIVMKSGRNMEHLKTFCGLKVGPQRNHQTRYSFYEYFILYECFILYQLLNIHVLFF
jgi:hypothetical protein